MEIKNEVCCPKCKNKEGFSELSDYLTGEKKLETLICNKCSKIFKTDKLAK